MPLPLIMSVWKRARVHVSNYGNGTRSDINRQSRLVGTGLKRQMLYFWFCVRERGWARTTDPLLKRRGDYASRSLKSTNPTQTANSLLTVPRHSVKLI